MIIKQNQMKTLKKKQEERLDFVVFFIILMGITIITLSLYAISGYDIGRPERDASAIIGIFGCFVSLIGLTTYFSEGGRYLRNKH